MYSYRFEEYALRMLIGSNEEEVAGRLGISAETVSLIVENQLKDDREIDPTRVITHVGFDEISLKKRHKLYVPWMTYETWKTGILNYFDGRYTNAAGEGINNKARAITKRCYGVKSAGTLFSRLILDLNRASEAVGGSIGELRQIAARLKAVFLGFCT